MSTASPSRPSFTDAVRAEELPTSFTWHARDTIALLAIPALFGANWLATRFTDDPAAITTADAAMRIAIFAVLVVANASLLRRHWRAFLRAPWRSIGLVLAGMVVIQVVITVLGSLLRPLVDGGSATAGSSQSAQLATGVLLFASLAPTVTALIEDFTFRHTLFLKLPVFSRRGVTVLVMVVNALVFGAIHLNNFGGELLLTLSYAGAGLVMNLVYLWTRNIWHVLLMHALNNFILGGPVTVLLVLALQSLVG